MYHKYHLLSYYVYGYKNTAVLKMLLDGSRTICGQNDLFFSTKKAPWGYGGELPKLLFSGANA